MDDSRFKQAFSGGLTGGLRPLGARDLTEEERREEEAYAGAGGALGEETPQAYRVQLEDMEPSELLLLKARIDVLLAQAGLTKLNLEDEFLVQLAHARGLQADLRDGLGKPGERAAALNAASTVLKDIVKLREQVVSLERMSKLEAAIVKIMRGQPPEIRDEFLSKYREIVEKYGEV